MSEVAIAPKLTAEWLRAHQTQAVLGAIAAGGFDARIVGGAVRNALFGLPVKDIDIATTALPAEVMAIAADSGFACVATGIAHGTVTVICDHHPFEVTTLRRDVETFGRHAKVAFTDDWVVDAGRRDFTMNALYAAADGTIHDPLGGLGDLMARRVRFIGDARARIREDYLRILRFFRFTAQYGDGVPDAEGLLASVRERGGLAQLSGERVHQEFVRLLVAPRVMPAVRAMLDHGLFTDLIGIAPRPTILERLVEIDGVAGFRSDPMVRLAALGVATIEDARRLAARLKISAAERKVLKNASSETVWRMVLPPQDSDGRRLLYRLGRDDYQRAVALAWARALGVSRDDPGWLAALLLPDRWTVPDFPAKGADVIARGVRPGPAVGEILRGLEAWWVDGDFAADHAAVMGRLDKLVARHLTGP